MKKLNTLQKLKFKKMGYTDEEIKKGYALFESGSVKGAVRLEMLDDIEMYESDAEAASVALKQEAWDSYIKVDGITEIFPNIQQNRDAVKAFAAAV